MVKALLEDFKTEKSVLRQTMNMNQSLKDKFTNTSTINWAGLQRMKSLLISTYYSVVSKLISEQINALLIQQENS